MKDEKNNKIDVENLHVMIKDVWENYMPFHKYINQKVIKFSCEYAEIGLKNNDNLIIENSIKNLHGGVIASVLDNTGALIAITNFAENNLNFKHNNLAKRTQNIATIDLNVNYLRPASGNEFICKGKLLNSSKKFILTNMEFSNESNDLIAIATGKYMIH